MGSRDQLCAIHLFFGIGDREADALGELLRERTLAKGEVVFHQDAPGTCLYLIVKGAVKLSRTWRDGREVTVTVLREGNFFGHVSG